MQSKLLMILGSFSIAACRGGTGPNAIDLTGTYTGTYTVTIRPHLAYQGNLQIIQNGDSVSGVLSTTSGRSAFVWGRVTKHFIAMRFAFIDTCGGGAATIATITNSGRNLTGGFTKSGGCDGQYSGGYNLTRQ